jgi:putative cell wall-binding protein
MKCSYIICTLLCIVSFVFGKTINAQGKNKDVVIVKKDSIVDIEKLVQFAETLKGTNQPC